MQEIYRFINNYRVEEEEELEVDIQRIIVSPSANVATTTTASTSASSVMIMNGKLEGLAVFLNDQLKGTSQELKASYFLSLIELKVGANLIEISNEEKKKLLYKVEAYCLK